VKVSTHISTKSAICSALSAASATLLFYNSLSEHVSV
jgi:hypothetical protein